MRVYYSQDFCLGLWPRKHVWIFNRKLQQLQWYKRTPVGSFSHTDSSITTFLPWGSIYILQFAWFNSSYSRLISLIGNSPNGKIDYSLFLQEYFACYFYFVNNSQGDKDTTVSRDSFVGLNLLDYNKKLLCISKNQSQRSAAHKKVQH